MTPTAEPPIIIAFDVETTGLDPKANELLEIGAVRCRVDGETIDSFQQLIRPIRPIPPSIVDITGISYQMVETAPGEATILARFVEWSGSDALLAAHNAPFDAEFLAEAAGRHGITLPGTWRCIDTLPWARSRLKGLKDYKLPTLLTHIRFKPKGHHRALADAEGVSALVTHIWNTYKSPAEAFGRLVEPFHSMATPPPATDRQIEYLQQLGVQPPLLTGLTKRGASQLIDSQKKKLEGRVQTGTRSAEETAAPRRLTCMGCLKLTGCGTTVLLAFLVLMGSCL